MTKEDDSESLNNAAEKERFLGGVGKYENLRINKNVVFLGIAFMLHFTAFHGTANLQSTINSNESMGTYTLAAIYGSLIISNIFLPVAVIRYAPFTPNSILMELNLNCCRLYCSIFGCKWTIALSFITYMPFILAQFYPRLYTLVPGGAAVGFGGGPLWCAKCTYLTVIAEAFSTLIGSEKKQDAMIVRFFGLFFLFYQMAQVWGNLISSSGENMALISIE